MAPIYANSKTALQHVLRMRLSDKAKLVACYLIGIQSEKKMPSVESTASSVGISLEHAFFAFQELLDGQVITGTPDRYELVFQESPISRYTDTLISHKNRGRNDLECPPPITTLLARYRNLHERFVQTEFVHRGNDLARLRAFCKKHGPYVVAEKLDSFFQDGYFAHYKNNVRNYITLDDFANFLDRGARQPSKYKDTRARLKSEKSSRLISTKSSLRKEN